MRIQHTCIMLFAGLLLVPSFIWSQGQRGFRGGVGGEMPGPDAMFEKMSGGKDVIVLSEMEPRRQQFFQMILSQRGLTGDRITREQFTAAMGKARSNMDSTISPPMGTTAVAPSSTAPAAPLMPFRNDMIDSGSERRFRDMDKNNDGLLSYEEMPEEIQRERDTWDTNKDGFIDLNEYKAFRTARFARPASNNDAPNLLLETPQATPPHEDARPIIFRAGKLPKELPEWFARLDQQGDNDGQVGLYEWRKDSRPLGEFLAMDLNGDGYLTAEEYLLWKSKNPTKKGSAGEAIVTDTSALPIGLAPFSNPVGSSGTLNLSPRDGNGGGRSGGGQRTGGGGWGKRPGGDSAPGESRSKK